MDQQIAGKHNEQLSIGDDLDLSDMLRELGPSPSYPIKL